MPQWWQSQNYSGAAWGSNNWRHGGGKWSQQPARLADEKAWWTCPATKCVHECRVVHNRGPWCNPTKALVCQACSAPKPTQVPSQPRGGGTTLSQLQAALGTKKTYAQAAAPVGAAPNVLLTGKVSSTTVEVPAVKEDDAFDMTTDAEEAAHTTPLAVPEEFVVVARLLVHP